MCHVRTDFSSQVHFLISLGRKQMRSDWTRVGFLWTARFPFQWRHDDLFGGGGRRGTFAFRDLSLLLYLDLKALNSAHSGEDFFYSMGLDRITELLFEIYPVQNTRYTLSNIRILDHKNLQFISFYF